MPYESEAATEAFESEGYESEGIGEWGEAARRRMPRTASGRGLVAVPQSRNFVTFTALRQALDKVGAQIKTNSDAITTVGARLNSTSAALKKEIDDRKKDADSARNDMSQKVGMLALLPLIMTPPTYTIPTGTTIPIAGSPATSAPLAISPPPTSTANALLPILLIGGFGTASGSGSGGMDTSMLLVMALILAGH